MAKNPPFIWIITGGRRGDIVQCRAVAEGLSDHIVEKAVNPRAPFRWFMPHGSIDPRESSLIAPPYPDLVIASGRRSVPYVKALKKATQGKCRAIFMKYPGCDTSKLGLVWIPEHDKRYGPHIINTLTSPHLVTPEKLQEHSVNIDPRIDTLPEPRLGIILGGNTKNLTFDSTAATALCAPLKVDLPFASFLVTGSRRTPHSLLHAVREIIGTRPSFIWDGSGDNPYFSILANSNALLVTGDSHNLVSETLACGKQVYVYNPPDNPPKFQWVLSELENRNLIKSHNAPLVADNIPAYDATPEIVSKIKAFFDL